MHYQTIDSFGVTSILIVPYNWAGTGHVIYDGSVYYNKFNTTVLIRYSLDEMKILAERRNCFIF